MDNIFDSREYKTSRRAYSAQCMFEYFISLLSTDAFLAKLLKDIGLSDALTGIVSSIISFAFLFQLMSIPLVGRIKSVKKSMIGLDTASQVLFAAMYLIPFLPFGVNAKAAAVTVTVILAYLTLYLNSSICYKWGNSFVSPDGRGLFSAIKEMVSLLGGMFFTLGAGLITDRFESRNNLHGAFVFLSAAMLVICVFNFICLYLMKDIQLSESKTRKSLKKTAVVLFKNKKCRDVVILTSAAEIAKYITIGFMGTYKTGELGFSVGQIQLINIASNLGRFAVSRPFGIYSDKKSYADGYFLGTIILLAAFITGIFISPKTRFLIIVFMMLYNISAAGTGQNTFSMMYKAVDDEYIMPAMSVSNSARGILGFCASLVGSAILTRVQNNGNSVCGAAVYGQQILCAVSAILTAAVLIFNKKMISNKEREREVCQSI